MEEPARVQRLARIVDSPAFAVLVLGVIVANAVVLGLRRTTTSSTSTEGYSTC